MDETFLPWWLVLLLAMWAAALTTWRCHRIHQEIRLWAGLSTLVYMGLIFVACGVGSSPSSSPLPDASAHQISNAAFYLFMAVSLVATVWCVGRGPLWSRRVGYVLFSLANAAVVGLLQGPEIATGLLIVAIISARPCFNHWRLWQSASAVRSWLVAFIQFKETKRRQIDSGKIFLEGGLCFVVSCVLLGTLSFCARVENSRAASSQRLSSLPSRSELERMNTRAIDSDQKTYLLDLALGQRSDVVLLMSVIVFLCLAMCLNEMEQTRVSGIRQNVPVLKLSEESSSEGLT